MRKCLAKFLSDPPAFTVITKPIIQPLPIMTRIQTDGSYSQRKLSRTAVLYRDRKGVDTRQCKTYLNHSDSTESEWCSVLDGITYAVRKDEGFIQLENDNLGVMQCLTRFKDGPRPGRYHRYYVEIQRQLYNFDYVGVRWIPREMNAADAIFRGLEQ